MARKLKLSAVYFACALLVATGLRLGLHAVQSHPASRPTASPHTAAVSTHKAAGRLSLLQSCQRLRADMLGNGGTADTATLLYVAGRTTSSQLAREARYAAATPPSSPAQQIAVAGIAHDCDAVAVQLPTP